MKAADQLSIGVDPPNSDKNDRGIDSAKSLRRQLLTPDEESLNIRTDMSGSQQQVSLAFLGSADGSQQSMQLSMGSFTDFRSSKQDSRLEKFIALLNSMSDVNEDIDESTARDFMINLTDLTLKTLREYKDPAFKRILKAFGWTGQRYSNTEIHLLDCRNFANALSNLYLKHQYQRNVNIVEGIDVADEINQIEKIAAFCPDLVVECLRQNSNMLLGSLIHPPSFPLTGACMIIDISGFSKFSAAMCSKGVNGLDELRRATSGMLGLLVKAVYEHDGDGKLIS